MHELSIAMEVCRLAEARLGTAGCAAVRRVAVEVGDQAGVEPESLAFCLEVLLAEPPFGAARPVIVRQPGEVLRVAYLEVDDGDPDHRGP
jgi:Zn finger protein HypA/HybF involved in hydrogenase expression